MFPIRVETRTDEQDVIELGMLVNSGSVAVRLIVFGSLIAFYLVFMAVYYSLYRTVPILLLIFCAILIGWFVFLLCTPMRIRKAARKSIEKRGVSECVYVFFEDHFESEYRNKLASGNETVSYSMITKAVETNERFFLFQGRGLAHIIHKNGMRAEEVQALRGALQGFLPGRKYKLLRK